VLPSCRAWLLLLKGFQQIFDNANLGGLAVIVKYESARRVSDNRDFGENAMGWEKSSGQVCSVRDEQPYQIEVTVSTCKVN
jgi:hypothetical protein